MSKDTILFQCHAQSANFGQQNNIELATCGMTINSSDATQLENDDREAMFQSNCVLVNKLILDELVKSYSTDDFSDDLFPIGVQLIGK